MSETSAALFKVVAVDGVMAFFFFNKEALKTVVAYYTIPLTESLEISTLKSRFKGVFLLSFDTLCVAWRTGMTEPSRRRPVNSHY